MQITLRFATPMPVGQPEPPSPHEAVRRDRLHRRCIVASLLLHLAILFALFLWPRDVPQPEERLVVVELQPREDNGSAGAAGGRAGSGGGGHPTDEGSAALPSASAEPAAIAPEATAPPPMVATQTATAPPETTEPSLLVAPPVKPRPQPPRPAPPKPLAKPAPPVERTVAETPPLPSATAEPSPAPSPSPGQAMAAESAQPGTAASGTTDGGAGGAAGIGTGVRGAGSGMFGTGQGPGDDYLEKLRRWLAKYKNYPADSLKRKEEGSVLVAFVLARDGTVIDARIEQGSGFPLIDQAVLDMMHNASPVPPVPAGFTGDRLRIAMPVRFSLGFLDRLQ